ncbi:MAG TPA: hypothetical protein VKC51_09990 [Lacunisphaera sp.]|nr:hypothetical protein [Lacunisphaera sp.]
MKSISQSALLPVGDDHCPMDELPAAIGFGKKPWQMAAGESSQD